MTRATAAAAALLLGLLLAGCDEPAGGSPAPATPDAAACEQAMRDDLAAAVAGSPSATPAERPAACEGVPQAELEAIVARLLSGE